MSKHEHKPCDIPCAFYTDIEVAAIFGVGPRCVWKWAEDGKLPKPIQIARRWTRWRRVDIDEAVAKLHADAQKGGPDRAA
jgi:predicted DNA-binding transcriptional regulator AlpA